MGHRFSKTAANNIAAKTTLQTGKLFNTTSTSISTCVIPIPKSDQNNFLASSINLQTPENLTNSSASSIKNNCKTTAGILQQHQKQHQYNTNKSNSSLNSLSSLSCGRQIIIEINLAKMENGYETSTPLSQYPICDNSLDTLSTDCNLNSTKLTTPANQQFLNLTLNSGNNSNDIPKSNSIAITTTTTTTLTTTSSSVSLLRTAGSSLNKNNNFSSIDFGNKSFMSTSKMNEWPERFNFLQFNDEIAEKNTDELVEYCEVVEDRHQLHQTNNTSCSTMRMLSIHEEPNNETNVCCRRKSKSMAANSGSSVSLSNNMGAKTKSRCRKCSCRDAFKRFLDPSLPRSSNKANKQQKEQKHTKLQDRDVINNFISNSTSKQQQHGHLLNSIGVNSNTKTPISNTESLWDSQFVVVQCAIVNPSNAGIHSLPNINTTSSLSTSSLISLASQNMSPSPTTSSATGDSTSHVPLNNIKTDTSAAPIVHSQIDFVHYLVPDLENVISSSFYWGKIDRYEAERLLEGKPEGTFLLRDSAQEEFLFSVTFRKYGRSLHARIEQSNHRFSFDCHDPCVFTAPTVTGLLEHYKDPNCVMFFEPMLTIPLHRKNCFSLQKLCRAAIVSNTTYDGINELELPSRMKSYLKEYHYKQKLRTKSNELTYGLHCK